MKSNRISRTACLILACLMLLPLFACGKSEQGSAETTAITTSENAVSDTSADTTTAATEATENTDAMGYLKDDLDPSLNYGGKTVNLLHGNAAEHE